MKLIYVLVLLLGIQKNKNIEHPIKISIELPDTIYIWQHDIPIILKVENTTSETLSIRDPSYWGNTYPYIKRGEKHIIPFRIRPSSRVYYYVRQIKGHEILRMRAAGSLDELVGLGDSSFSSGKYDIYFRYYYEPKKELYKKMLRKKNKQIVEEKYIISDICTFYVK